MLDLVRRLIPAFVVTLVAATATWLAWPPGNRDTTGIDDTESALVLDEQAFEAVDPSERSEPEAGSTELPEGLRELTRERVAAPPAEARPLTVQVWDGKEGVPAGGCEVFFLEERFDRDGGGPFAQHWSTLAEDRGRRFAADASGRVALPAIERRAIVAARRDGKFGFRRIGRRHADVEPLTLQVDETVIVRVTDGEGQPVARVPVGILQRVVEPPEQQRMRELMANIRALRERARNQNQANRNNPAQRRTRERNAQLRMQMAELEMQMAQRQLAEAERRAGRPSKRPPRTVKPSEITTRNEVRARRRTDERGVATFRHFQIYRRNPEPWWPAEHVDRHEAVLLLPLPARTTRAFAGRPAPREPIELTMPPTGSVVLRPVDRKGKPFAHPVRVELEGRGPKSPRWSRMRRRMRPNRGRIEFPFVGLGMEFLAHCRLDDDDFRWDFGPFAGPTRAGEAVTLDVVVAPESGMLTGRIVDTAGKPLARAQLSFLINSSVGRLEGEDVRLDPKGRFHLPFEMRKPHGPPFRLEVRRRNSRPTEGTTRPLPTVVNERITDLGDLEIAAFERIGHGRITDDLGRPIRGATVQLQRERRLGERGERLRFVDEAFAMARTDEQGQYELFGQLEAARYRLRVRARDHFGLESGELRRGQRADFELMRRSKVVGTLLVPEWLRSERVRVRLTSASGNGQVREERVHDHRGKRYVYFDWVRPGVYGVELRIREFPDPILRVDAVSIEAGQTNAHPNLVDLDLRPLIHRFEITAADSQRRAVKPNWPLVAGIVSPGGKTRFVGIPWKGSRVDVVSASPQLTVWPMARGYRAERTTLSAGKSELRFLAYPPVELQLPGLRQLVGNAMVWIKLRALASDTTAPRTLETWDRTSGRVQRRFAGMLRRKAGTLLGKNDTVRIAPMADGRFQVMVYLLATGGKRKTRPVGVGLGQVDVRLVPGGPPQRLVATVDAAKVRAGLSKLAQAETGK